MKRTLAPCCLLVWIAAGEVGGLEGGGPYQDPGSDPQELYLQLYVSAPGLGQSSEAY